MSKKIWERPSFLAKQEKGVRNMGNRMNLLPEESGRYKANLHCHTTISDGKLTPEEIKRAYSEQGYQIVAFTDHRKYVQHTELNDAGFIALAGVEVDMNEIRPGKERIRTRMYHLNFYDTDPGYMPEMKAQYCAADYWNHTPAYVNGYIQKMAKLGFIACYNHPYWSMHTADDYLPLEGLFAMEIYNHGCELDGLYGYTPQAYEEMLRAGKRIFCLSTDDNHNAYPFGDPLCDSFGGWTVICAEEFTYAGIIKALRAGNFYSTMGPELRELYIEDGILTVKTSPAQKIYVNMKGKNCYKEVSGEGDTLTEARFPLTGREGYIRVTVKDSRNRFANSNAYFTEISGEKEKRF